MKTNLLSSLMITILLATPVVSLADTFFADDFSHGSTTNGVSIPGGTPTASNTSYDIAASKNAQNSAIAPHDLTVKLNAATTSGYVEAQALFTTNPVALVSPGDYVDLQVVFTNTAGSLLAGGTKSLIALGLYNSGTGGGTNLNPPVAGALANAGLSDTAGSSYATANCATWLGFSAQISSGGTSRIQTRPIQNNGGTASGNQELLLNGVSAGTYKNPGGSAAATGTTSNLVLAAGSVYTMELMIVLTPTNTLTISNFLYSGAGALGTMIYAQGTASTTNYLSGVTLSAFDGLAVGSFNSGTSLNPIMDIISIAVTGQSTTVSAPPIINTQPLPVSIPVGGSAMFSVSASGINMTYQWHRHGTNLVNEGNISGATSSTLIIAPVTSADFLSDYYLTITGAGNYSTNSVNVSMSSRTALNLVWNGAGAGDGWDLAASADWLNGANPAVFNYGDNVTFDDTAVLNTVALNYSYLSPGSITVNSDYPYKFQGGSGSIAGLSSLSYIGPARLTINNANSYSGGTLISNASAYLYLGNLAGLGSGPVVFGQAGGQMEIPVSGGNASGISGNVVIADDFTIQLDGTGSYGGVFFGDLAGTAGKTLTFNVNTTNSTRIRVYGSATVCDANLVLNGVDPAGGSAVYVGTTLAPYNNNGSQIYNGVISGVGGIIQRANGTTILNGANTYSGGTTPSTGVIALGRDSIPASGTATSGPLGIGALFLAPEVPNATGSGTVLAWGDARTIANPVQYPSATNNQTLVIGGTNALTFTGPITLQGNDGSGAVNRTFTISNSAPTTLSGLISDGGLNCGLIKSGNGVLALNNAETYAGPTTVSAGTLQINGSLAAGSAVTVATNGTLGGTGTIGGSVTLNQGGAIAPGASIGTLNIGGNFRLAGNLKIEVNKASSPSSDMIAVTGSITNNGTGAIIVTNIGTTALQAGDVFNLFNGKAVIGGASMTVSGGGSSVTWTNRLAVDGTIAVLSLLPSTPTNITYSVSGGTLTLAWPSGYMGYLLQSNSVGIMASNSWFDVPGSGAGNTYPVTLEPLRTNIFYRLRNP